MKYSFVACLCGLASFSYVPGAVAGVTELPSIALSEVYITNTSSSSVVNFQVSGNSCDGALNASLKPDNYGTYKCEGASSFRFSITTAMLDGSRVNRTAMLAPSKRYEIYVDSQGAWNIREIYSR
jgi:hypothetical protein